MSELDGSLRLVPAPELADLLTLAHRVPGLAVPVDGTSTLGHVVQSCGIPLTEVGALLLDGEPVPPGARSRPGRLEVHPVARPQRTAVPPPRFLLDVHLGSLARRLRLLGIDSAYPTTAAEGDDLALVAAANAERRVLLTQDRGLLRRRALAEG